MAVVKGLGKYLKTKKIYTIIAIILLVLLYVVIFCFSAEDAQKSSSVSVRVTEILLNIYYKITGGSTGGAGIGGEEAADAIPILEGFVRKLAHFTEYMCMGFLSYSIVVLWYRPLWKGWLFVLVQVFLSAGIDEIHQYFIPGRYASFKDVMIDTAGGIAGMMFLLVCWGTGKLLIKRK